MLLNVFGKPFEFFGAQLWKNGCKRMDGHSGKEEGPHILHA